MSSQTPHIQRLLLTAFVTGIPEHKVRCISPDVGGAFGTKIFCYADMALVMFASKAIGGRPVKWVESRTESYGSTIHGRDHITYLEIAGTRDGEVTGLRVKTFANLGGRLSTIGPGIPTTLYGRVLSGPLQVPERVLRGDRRLHQHDLRGRLPRRRPAGGDLRRRTGDGPVRRRDRDGSGRAPAAELHRARTSSRTTTRPASAPPSTARRSSSTRATTSRPWTRRWRPSATTNMAAKKAEAKSRGKLLGVGLSTYIEVCGVAPSKWIGAVGEGWGAAMWESANIKVHLTGKIIATVGHPAAGPGPRDDLRAGHRATSWACRWRTSSSSTRTRRARRSATGRTAAGRSSVGMTAAVKAAAKVREKARRYAAHMLEANVEDIEVDGANYRVKGSPDKVKTIQEIAFAIDLGFSLPPDMEPYLDETAYHDTPNCTWPFGTHIAIVEVDEETGEVDLVRYVAVDDVGKKINPMIVDGQLHGGIAQGVGQALWEGAIYGDDGQLQSGSMLDYALPRASWFPNLELDETVTPSPVNPLGVKGVGEAGGDREHRGRGERRDRRARARSASAISTCRTRPRPCGVRSRLRREARRDPGGIRLPALGFAGPFGAMRKSACHRPPPCRVCRFRAGGGRAPYIMSLRR